LFSKPTTDVVSPGQLCPDEEARSIPLIDCDSQRSTEGIVQLAWTPSATIP
jgi:hypothetical protein